MLIVSLNTCGLGNVLLSMLIGLRFADAQTDLKFLMNVIQKWLTVIDRDVHDHCHESAC